MFFQHLGSKSEFFSEGIFLHRGFSLSQSEHPLFLHFPGLFFKTFFDKVESFLDIIHTTIKT